MFKTRFLAKASISEVVAEKQEVAQNEQEDEYIEQQADLMRIDAVLVSTGWNGNDDIFTKKELLPARSTARHKPLNLEHKDTQIVGHMIDSHLETKQGEIIQEEDIVNNPLDVPRHFDVVAESVMYAYVFPGEARKIREKAQKDELFVSVEMWFADYDYSVGNRVVARNAATAVHFEPILRINGGKGLVDGQRVGRVLKDLTVAGIGLVKAPANKDSVIRSVSTEKAECGVSDTSLQQLLDENTVGYLDDGVAKAAETVTLETITEEKTGSEGIAETETTGETENVVDESMQDVEAADETINSDEIVQAKKKTPEQLEQTQVDERFAELEARIAELQEQIVQRDKRLSAYEEKFGAVAEPDDAELTVAASDGAEEEKPSEEPKEEPTEDEKTEKQESEEATADTADDGVAESPAEKGEEETPGTDDTAGDKPPAADSDNGKKEEKDGKAEQPVAEVKEQPKEEPKVEVKEEPAPKQEQPTPKPETTPPVVEQKPAPQTEEPTDAAGDVGDSETSNKEEVVLDPDDGAIEDALEDALDNAEKEEEDVQFKSDKDGDEDNLLKQFVEVLSDLDIGIKKEDKEE